MLGRRFTSERIRRERRNHLITTGFLVVALIGAWLFLVVEVVNLKHLRVERVEFDGNKAVATEDLWEVIAPHLDGAYGGLFSKRNTFLAPREAMERDLLATFTRLDDVSVSRKGLRALAVESVEREPNALWCDTATSSSCRYLDDEGLAFATAPRLTGGTLIIYERAFPATVIGSYVTDEATFDSLRAFIISLEPLGFTTERVTWSDDALELGTRAVLGPDRFAYVVVRIPTAPPYDTAFSNLASVVQSGGPDDTPLQLADVDYIDVRFENKVFYKKDSVAPVASEE